MITVKLELLDSTGCYSIEYPNVDACTSDAVLRTLFDNNHVVSCTVHCAGLRITALPIMTWGRFVEHMESNRVTFLRRLAR